jgi:hypothetical protein
MQKYKKYLIWKVFLLFYCVFLYLDREVAKGGYEGQHVEG